MIICEDDKRPDDIPTRPSLLVKRSDADRLLYEIKIEKGVPVGRETSVSVLLNALLDLEVGNSFICPSGLFGAAEKARAMANKRDRKFTLRATNEGFRFWRVR